MLIIQFPHHRDDHVRVLVCLDLGVQRNEFLKKMQIGGLRRFINVERSGGGGGKLKTRIQLLLETK
jgi:hypothetical protein